jgi:hypothetical protein
MGCSIALPEARRRTRRLAVAAALAATALALRLFAADVPHPDTVAAMENFLARPATPHQYRAWRHLEASGVGQHGWLEAQTDFTLASGFLYEVTAEGGSGYIRTRVLRSLLDEEQKIIALANTASAAISTDNYQFRPEGVNEEGLAVVGMTPRRKDKALIAGRLLLTPLEGDLVRLEGRLAKNPSFWVARTSVVRSYRRINGVLMPVALETTAQLRLLGSSALRMTYRYSHIDERPVNTEHADERDGGALDGSAVPPLPTIPLPLVPNR